MTRLLVVLLAAGLLAAGAAQAAPTATVLKLKADPNGALKFDKTKLTAEPGVVTIVFTNPSVIPHDVAIRGNGVKAKSKTIVKSTTKLTVKLKAGKYTFYCSVPGHEAAGMKGTLVVK